MTYSDKVAGKLRKIAGVVRVRSTLMPLEKEITIDVNILVLCTYRCVCCPRALFAYDALLQTRNTNLSASPPTADPSVGLARALQREGLSHVLHLCLDRRVRRGRSNRNLRRAISFLFGNKIYVV